MPGLLPPLDFDSGKSEYTFTFDLEEMPVAALIFRMRDRQCCAANRRLENLLGTARADVVGQAFDKLLGKAGGQEKISGFGEVRLGKADGRTVSMMMLALPMVQAGAEVLLCLFTEPAAQGWRSADLACAIEAVIREDMQWFSGAVMERLACRRSSAAGTGLAQLTPRERQILRLVCEGNDDADIAAELAISRNTLRNHLSNIYGKAGVKRRSQVVVWGRERGITAI